MSQQKTTCQAQRPALHLARIAGGRKPNRHGCSIRPVLTKGIQRRGCRLFLVNARFGGRAKQSEVPHANFIGLSILYNDPRGVGTAPTTVGLVRFAKAAEGGYRHVTRATHIEAARIQRSALCILSPILGTPVILSKGERPLHPPHPPNASGNSHPRLCRVFPPEQPSQPLFC